MKRSRNNVAVYGAGCFGREVAWLLSTLEDRDECQFVGYADDQLGSETAELDGYRIHTLSSLQKAEPDCKIFVSVAAPASRRQIVRACEPKFNFFTAIAPSVTYSSTVSIGKGSVICSGSALTVDIQIGQHCHINMNCTLGHDVKIGDFVTIAPGVHISGNVHIEDNVVIGTGVNIINGTRDRPLVIKKGCVIGAGACVVRSTESNGVYMGVPARRKSECC